MITGFAGCWLTARDHRLLGRTLQKLSAIASPLAPVLQEKLDRALVVRALDDDVAALGSHVEYVLDGCLPERRILVAEGGHGTVGLHLPLATARAIALIGMREGQSAEFPENGAMRQILLRRVLFQAFPAARPEEKTAEIIHLNHFARSRRLPEPRSKAKETR
jgi:regulator of nucleoside diphosphate kinase